MSEAPVVGSEVEVKAECPIIRYDGKDIQLATYSESFVYGYWLRGIYRTQVTPERAKKFGLKPKENPKNVGLENPKTILEWPNDPWVDFEYVPILIDMHTGIIMVINVDDIGQTIYGTYISKVISMLLNGANEKKVALMLRHILGYKVMVKNNGVEWSFSVNEKPTTLTQILDLVQAADV